MTVNGNLPISGPHIADGSNRQWEYSFRCDDVTHFYLEITPPGDDAEPYYIDTGFTVTQLGNDAGGMITYPIAPIDPLPENTFVRVFRNVPYTQPTRIGNQGRFYPQTHEDTFDLLEMQIQQLAAGVPPRGRDVWIDKFVTQWFLPGAIREGAVIAGAAISHYGILRAGIPGARFILTTAPVTEVLTINICKGTTSFGTVTFAAGETEGELVFEDDVAFEPGDLCNLITLSPVDSGATGLYATLIFARQ